MRRNVLIAASLTLVALFVFGAVALADDLNPKEQLGKALFFDTNLSLNANQSCAACHAPESGWTGPLENINAHGAVYEGSIPGMFGDRKPPSAAYGGQSPLLYYDASDGAWVGGMFWDGRATGWTLGDPLAEQAQGPFLNLREQALATPEDVIGIVQASSYATLFAEQCQGTNTTDLYNCIGRAIAAYERSTEVSPFTSKWDCNMYSKNTKGKPTAEEKLGRLLFKGKAKCAGCHPMLGKAPLFTDFTYDNLGLPKNPENPVYDWAGADFVDPGLGGFLKAAGYPEDTYMAEWGKHKVPTLRNVDKRPYDGFVKAYGHNGVFKSLEEIVHFYNTRDVQAWPDPEVGVNINPDELGNLGLTPKEEAAIVAFLKTLSDGYVCE